MTEEFTVRDANHADVSSILAWGWSDEVFAVSDDIRFYEREELTEWISHPYDNILLVAEIGGVPAGFLFCKVMSYHWAMLDNFYVDPKFRKSECAARLIEVIKQRLQDRKIGYLTTLTASEVLTRYIRRYGFKSTGTYTWSELFVC